MNSATALHGSAQYAIPPGTPPRLDMGSNVGLESPSTVTPSTTPKPGPDLRSVASMPSLQSFNSLHSFQSQNDLQDFDVLDFTQFDGGMYYDLDQLQTPDLDPLSPTFYELQAQISPPQHPLLTPELSGSVGSGTSISGMSQLGSSASISLSAGSQQPQAPQQQQLNQHSNLMATNIEGLGIAETNSGQSAHPNHYNQQQQQQQQQQQWPTIPSPDGSLRRSKYAVVPRVSKKPSKQTLKQRRSRASLNSEMAGPSSSSAGKRSSSPAPSSSASSRSSIASIPSPSKNTQATAASANVVNMPPPPLSLVAPVSQQLSTSSSHPKLQPSSTQTLHGKQHQQPVPVMQPLAAKRALNRAAPATPFHSNGDREAPRARGKVNASPAMQSPLRPGQQPRLRSANERQPRLPAAAAATALFMPPAQQQPDLTRQNSMAAAAAAAAASASHQQPVTPMADRQVPRISPTTLLLSNKTGGSSDTIKAHHSGVNSGAVAPSPTPAARMHSSSKLVATASDSSPAKGMWQAPRGPVALQQFPKPVLSPRKSASTSNMRRDARRKQNKVIPEMSSSLNQFQVDLRPKQRAHKVPSAAMLRTAQMASKYNSNHVPSQYSAAPPVNHARPQQQPQFDMPVYEMTENSNMAQQQSQMGMLQQQFPGAMDGPQAPNNMNNVPHMHNNGMAPTHHQHVPGPMPQMPAHLMQPTMGPAGPQTSMMNAAGDLPRSQTMPSVHSNGEADKVQPDGEPPQHVWASRPQPIKPSKRNSIATKHEGAKLQNSPYPSPLQQQALLEQQQKQLHNQHLQQRLQLSQHLQQSQAQRDHEERAQAQAQAQAQVQAQARARAQAEAEARAQVQSHAQDQTHTRTQHAPGPQDIPSSHFLRHSMPNIVARQPDMVPVIPADEAQDLSITSEFMAQFMNDDWNSNDIDLDARWDLMEALETPI